VYVFTTYAIDVAFGPAAFHNFTTGATSASWVGVARSLYGIFWFFVFLAIVNSTIANSNAGMNVSSRTAYAMGRIRVFPSFFAHINARHRSPVYSILAGFVITIAVTLALGLHYTPTTAFAMVGTGIVILLVAIYILMNVACIGYFARKRTGFNVLSHLIIPLLGIVAFVPAWLSGVGIPAFNFITPLTPPLSYMAPAVGIWMIIGLIYLIYLYARHKQRITEVGTVHLDPMLEYPSE